MNELLQIERLTECQIQDLHALYQGEWWSRDRTPEQTRRVVEHSDLTLGYVEAETGKLVAFARVLTDRVFKAFIFDVIVAPSQRGTGLGRQLVEALLAHPVLAEVEHVELYCLPELVPFYQQWGFTEELGAIRLLRRS